MKPKYNQGDLIQVWDDLNPDFFEDLNGISVPPTIKRAGIILKVDEFPDNEPVYLIFVNSKKQYFREGLLRRG